MERCCWTLFVLVCVLVCVACDSAQQQKPSHNAQEQQKAQALFTELTAVLSHMPLTKAQAQALWQLSQATSPVRTALLETAVAQPKALINLLKARERFMRTALVGLSRGQTQDSVNHLLALDACGERGTSAAFFSCLKLIGHLQDYQSASEEALTTLTSRLVTRVEAEQNMGALVRLTHMLPQLWGQMPTQLADRGAERILNAIESTSQWVVIPRLSRSLDGPAQRLSETKADELAERLLVRIETAPRDYAKVADGFLPLQKQLPGRAVDAIAERIMIRLESEEDSFRQRRLIRVLDMIAARVSQTTIDELSARFVTHAEATPDMTRRLELMNAIGIWGDRLPSSVADRGITLVVKHLGPIGATDYTPLLNIVRQIGGCLSSTTAQEIADILVSRAEVEIKKGTTRGKSIVAATTLLRTLGRLDVDLSPAIVERSIQLLLRAAETEKQWSRQRLIAPRLRQMSEYTATVRVAELAERTVTNIEAAQAPNELVVYTTLLRGIAQWISRPQAEALIRRLMVRAERAERTSFYKVLGQGLHILAEHVSEETVGEIATRLVVLIEKEDQLRRLPYMMNGLRSLSVLVSEKKADELAERLVVSMADSPEASWLAEMVNGLEGFAETVSDKKADQLAAHLAGKILVEEDEQRLAQLVSSMALFGQHVSAAKADELAQHITAVSIHFPNPSCGSFDAFVRPTNLPLFFDVLKWPTCSWQAQLQIIDAIGKAVGQSFDKDDPSQLAQLEDEAEDEDRNDAGEVAESNEDEFGEPEEQEEFDDQDGPDEPEELPASVRVDYWKFLDFAETWAAENNYDLDAPPPPPQELKDATS